MDAEPHAAALPSLQLEHNPSLLAVSLPCHTCPQEAVQKYVLGESVCTGADDASPSGGASDDELAIEDNGEVAIEQLSLQDNGGSGKEGKEGLVGDMTEEQALVDLQERYNARHKVHLSKEEYDRMMEESDDDETPHGRARKRIKSDINADCYRMHMLGPNDEGIVLDCSVRPRDLER